MKRKALFKRFRILTVALAVLSGAADVSSGQIKNVEQKISSFLLKSVNNIEATARALKLSNQAVGARYSSKHFFLNHQAQLYVEVVTLPSSNSLAMNTVYALGGSILNSTSENIYCMLPYDEVKNLAASPSVLYIAQGPVPATRTGSALTAGDAQLLAADARNYFYANGSGVTVGVISNGMQYRQNSITLGDLPSYIIDVDNAYAFTGREGTAMMEIVYDMAPNATLAFGGSGTYVDGQGHTIPTTPLDMANRITHLAQAGCKVIVDDVWWQNGYPYFQDWDITTAIEQFVSSSHGSYISAAGNDAEHMWAGSSAPASVFGNKWMLFSGSDTALTITVSGNDSLFVVLQWADPWNYSNDNLDLFFANQQGTLLDSSTTFYGQGVHPEEQIIRYVTQGTYKLLVRWTNYTSGRNAKDFRVLVLQDNNSDPSLNYKTSNYHVYGHSAAENCISVAAYGSGNPTNVRSFSSRGPAKMVTSGGSVFERQHPKITATDSVDTRVGLDGHFSQPFSGTSASSPHVAGIAALYYSRYPTHTTANFFSAMTSSAAKLGSIGQGGVWNNVTGFGKIRAYDALIKGLTVLNSPQVTSNTTWALVRVAGNANIAADKIVTIPASTTSLIEGTVTFGNVNARITVEGTLILAAGVVLNPDNIIVTGSGRLVGGSFTTVEVNQLDEQQVPYDSVGRWRYGAFEKHAAPYSFTIAGSSNETFRSKQEFKSGTTQKYNKWDQSSNVVNHHTFTADSQHAFFASHFKTSQDGIAVKADLHDAPGVSGATVRFKDPWLIDYADPSFGNKMRNRGNLGAIWYDTLSSPFNPSTSSNWKGVFLNESGPQTSWAPPYYSVGAPAAEHVQYQWQQLLSVLPELGRHECAIPKRERDPNGRGLHQLRRNGNREIQSAPRIFIRGGNRVEYTTQSCARQLREVSRSVRICESNLVHDIHRRRRDMVRRETVEHNVSTARGVFVDAINCIYHRHERHSELYSGRVGSY